MFNNNLPVSSLFCKIFAALSASQSSCTHPLHFLFFYLLYSMHHSSSMHHLSSVPPSCCTPPSSLHMHHTQQQQHQSLLCSIFLYSLCILCMLCVSWFCILCMSSALPVHHGNSSASLVVFPRVQHHWMSC
jgi:hypothetical protein